MTPTLKAFYRAPNGDLAQVEGETLQELCDALKAAGYEGWYVHALELNKQGFYDRVAYVNASDYFA